MWTVKCFSAVLLLLYVSTTADRVRRIVGGSQIDVKSTPFVISLEYKSRQICGGAVLSNDWVLTAAHCFGNVFDIEKSLVRVGTDERQKGGSEHTVLIILKFPKFNISVVDNDVALMQIFHPLEYSENIAPIGLPSPDEKLHVGQILTVLGWGYTKEKGEPSERLRGVSVPVFSHEECKGIYEKTLDVTPNMICLGFREGGRDACILDSGGPLVSNTTLFGIVSWGWGCARPGRPGVYTDLTKPHILRWIRNVLKYKLVSIK